MDTLRQPRPVLMLASVFAVLATLFTYLYLTRRASAVQASGTTPVLVANQELRPGTIIQREMVTLSERSTAAVPKDALYAPTQAIGQVSSRPITAGEVLTDDSVLAGSAALGPAYTLPASMRAVTVQADAVQGIAGFITPGHRVDVLATFNRNEEATTRVVLQDIEVLAVGTQTDPQPQKEAFEGTRSVGSLRSGMPVTLAVTVPDAERLVLADTRGKIRLALRPGRGATYSSSPGAIESQLSGLAGGWSSGGYTRGSVPAAGSIVAEPGPSSAPVASRSTGSVLPWLLPQPERKPATVRAAPVATVPSNTVRPTVRAGAVTKIEKPDQHRITVVRGSAVETVILPTTDEPAGAENGPDKSGSEKASGKK